MPRHPHHRRRPGQASGVTRRQVLGSAVTASSATLVPFVTSRSTRAADAQAAPVFENDLMQVLIAFTGRIVPSDENGPGAVEAGAAVYINRSLAEWNSDEVPFLRAGLRALDDQARSREGGAFTALEPARQDALLEAMEAGELEGFDEPAAVFERLHRLTLEGMFCDPYYGGNRHYIGWDLIGYPGAVLASTPAMQRMGERLEPLHTSAYGGEYDGE